jgi:glycosyltransferase involved in cell wall biosynthesis
MPDLLFAAYLACTVSLPEQLLYALLKHVGRCCVAARRDLPAPRQAGHCRVGLIWQALSRNEKWMTVFKIVVPMYNVSGLIRRNIEELRAQTCRDFQCLLIDDVSTDATVATAAAAIRGDSRFDLIANTERRFALRNAADGIARLAPDPEDIIVSVDADDYLASPGVLERIESVYALTNCRLTYGSYRKETGARGRECVPYPAAVVAARRYRRAQWHATHLKTFRAWLWPEIPSAAFTTTRGELARVCRHALLHGWLRAWLHWRKLNPAELTDPSCCYFRRCCDKAFMFPLLELAGSYIHHVPDILYVYRDVNPTSPYSVPRHEAKWLTRCIQTILRLRPPLDVAFF